MSKHVELDYYQLVPEETSEEVDLKKRNLLKIGGVCIAGGVVVGGGNLAAAAVNFFSSTSILNGNEYEVHDREKKLAEANNELYKKACAEDNIAPLDDTCAEIDALTGEIDQINAESGSILSKFGEDGWRNIVGALGGFATAALGTLIYKFGSKEK